MPNEFHGTQKGMSTECHGTQQTEQQKHFEAMVL
jgi:hypothetical protein